MADRAGATTGFLTGRGWYTLYHLANARGIYELTSLNKTQVLVAYLKGILRRDLAPYNCFVAEPILWGTHWEFLAPGVIFS